jgi:hypothetical protein
MADHADGAQHAAAAAAADQQASPRAEGDGREGRDRERSDRDRSDRDRSDRDRSDRDRSDRDRDRGRDRERERERDRSRRDDDRSGDRDRGEDRDARGRRSGRSRSRSRDRSRREDKPAKRVLPGMWDKTPDQLDPRTRQLLEIHLSQANGAGHGTRSTALPVPVGIGGGHAGLAGTASANRPQRTIYIGNVKPGISETDLGDFLNHLLRQVPNRPDKPGNAIADIALKPEKSYAFVEFRDTEDADIAIALDGAVLKTHVLRLRRTNNYQPVPGCVLHTYARTHAHENTPAGGCCWCGCSFLHHHRRQQECIPAVDKFLM